MKKIILISTLILIGCGPSNEERQDIAQLTCNIMGESRNMDAAFRLKEINAAREKLGESVYLGSDEKIKESFEYDLCVSLVLDDDYDQKKKAIDLVVEEERRRVEEESRRIAEAKEDEEEEARIMQKKEEYDYQIQFIMNTQGVSQVDAIVQLVSGCYQWIEGNDMLQFNLKEMNVSSSCASITLTLKHTGVIMSHNWVLTTDADFMPVASAGAGAGLAKNYVPVGDDRVLAATRVIGGGEETSITFSIENLSAGDAYTFFCSFPGHYALMEGSFNIL